MSKFHISRASISLISEYARLRASVNTYSQGRMPETYFLPIQFREPKEKGWKHSVLSFEKRGWCSHRSGLKLSGSVKLLGLWYIGHCQMFTTVYVRVSLNNQAQLVASHRCAYASWEVVTTNNISPLTDLTRDAA